MNTEQERAEFEAWYQRHHGDRDVYVLDEYGEYADKRVQSAFNVWQARAALHSHDREDAATEATDGDENGGHRLVEPDHETALALADAPRSLRNYVAALRSAIAAAPTPPAGRAALQSQSNHDTTLFCDLKTDEEKCAFFLSGRGYETGVIAHAIQNDVAMAYHRCAEYKKELEALQSQDREDAGMAEIVREAAQIIAAIPPEHAPDNIRWPIVDELEGFASKIDRARRGGGEGE